jgi:hypothetical protein
LATYFGKVLCRGMTLHDEMELLKSPM